MQIYVSIYLSLAIRFAKLKNSPANAVHRLRQTEFLMDIVPRTVPYKRIVERKAKEEKAAAQLALENGVPIVNGTNGAVGEDAAEKATSTEPIAEGSNARAESAEDPNAQLERESQLQSEKTTEKTNGHHEENEDPDVEMADD